ncbi:hypothetical protein EJ04DRAFT_565311 [Polyplosphaeria fusca]|uniref:F-box domain-containing protein n=1 Tax=Polyplosphaeria fusca TaxID=682080 RepID=A0A9P4V067_9PLEO|nr:hypothetical protein EJ04DRAFT_565311 [Polyplosphaeria fusca]
MKTIAGKGLGCLQFDHNLLPREELASEDLERLYPIDLEDCKPGFLLPSLGHLENLHIELLFQVLEYLPLPDLINFRATNLHARSRAHAIQRRAKRREKKTTKRKAGAEPNMKMEEETKADEGEKIKMEEEEEEDAEKEKDGEGRRDDGDGGVGGAQVTAATA